MEARREGGREGGGRQRGRKKERGRERGEGEREGGREREREREREGGGTNCKTAVSSDCLHHNTFNMDTATLCEAPPVFSSIPRNTANTSAGDSCDSINA